MVVTYRKKREGAFDYKTACNKRVSRLIKHNGFICIFRCC